MMIKYCKDAETFKERCQNNFDTYKNDTLFQYACNMCIMQIGEMVNRLSDDFMESHQEIPWHAIRAMRNLYAHEYEKIDLKIVWETLVKQIPKLREQLENTL
ncbi:MAG: DUF86 domain-containing protein [Selenomonadaceae bacterium]|nr:DUF86 domain-containing protein [Selenomonadaceae bacterium]